VPPITSGGTAPPALGTGGKIRVAPKKRDQVTGDTLTTSLVDGACTM